MSILNERIKERRISQGFTLLRVADYLGVKEATAQRYESGDIKNIKHETVTQLAALFNCNPAYLMGWTDVPDLTTPPKSPSLSDEDERLLRLFYRLDSRDQGSAVGYIEGMLTNEKYRKEEQFGNAAG